jgi:hypothetical protein
MRFPLFWNVTHPRLVVTYRRFGTNDRSHFQWSRSPRSLFDCLTPEDGTDSFSRNVSKCQSTLRNIPEEGRSVLHDGGSTKSASLWMFIASLFDISYRVRARNWSPFEYKHAVAQLFESLRYKPEGFGFDFRWGHWNFYVCVCVRVGVLIMCILWISSATLTGFPVLFPQL